MLRASVFSYLHFASTTDFVSRQPHFLRRWLMSCKKTSPKYRFCFSLVLCCSTVSTASIIFIIWTTKVFKLVDCQTVSLSALLVCVLFCGGRQRGLIKFPSAGMEGPLGGRRLLAPALLHHSAGDHGAAEALGKLPEVRVRPERQLMCEVSFSLHSPFSVGCDSLGFLILL